jgi:Uncharacterised methyltransferase family (DUF6094)
VRPHGKIKLGFFPLPVAEAERLRSCLKFSAKFSALDPCVGDGRAFAHLVKGNDAYRYSVEIDAYRAEQAMTLGIDTLQADTMDVRCPAETFSLLYLNPPYDLEVGKPIIKGWNSYFSSIEKVVRLKERSPEKAGLGGSNSRWLPGPVMVDVAISEIGGSRNVRFRGLGPSDGRFIASPCEVRAPVDHLST